MRNCTLILMSLAMVILNSCKKSDETPVIVSDADGNIYKTITIGDQVWMMENLKTTKYSNGDLIGTSASPLEDLSGENTPKYQWAYSGDETKVTDYGRLYTWYTVNDSRNVCPTGWHVPTEAEWNTLTEELGGTYVAGGKLKASGTDFWNSPNDGATNVTYFTAMPAGYREYSGQFSGLGNYGKWWSATENTPDNANAKTFNVDTYTTYANSSYNNKKTGFSVRCLWDKK